MNVGDFADNIQDTSSPMGAISAGGSRTGNIETNGDTDVFAISLVAGLRYTFDLRGAPGGGGTLNDSYLRLLNSGGAQLAFNDDDTTRDSRIVFTATASGTYYLEARGYGTNTGTYTLSARVDDDYADTVSDTTSPMGTVAVGGSRTGNIETSGDTDVFAVGLTAGQTYTIRQTGGTNPDTYLRGLYTASSQLIANTGNDDFGGTNNSQVTFTASTSGTYYIQAGAYSSNTGTYTVSVQIFDDYADTVADTSSPMGTVAVGGSRTGSIETSGDTDVFAVGLTAGQTYTIRQTGGTNPDTYLRGLYTASGQLIANTGNDDFGGTNNSQVTFTASTSGTYYIQAGAYSSNTGTYTVSVQIFDDYADTVADTSSPMGTVAVGGSRTGSIETSGDTDVFSVSLTAGQTYTIRQTGGTNPDTYLRGLYTASGQLIANTGNDDFGGTNNSQVTFTASTSGTYYIQAGAYSSNTGTYTVSVQSGTVSTDIAATTATTATLAVGDRQASRIDQSGDVDWFRVTLAAGQTYSIEQNASTTSSSPLSDPFIRGIYNASGALISGTSNDDYAGTSNARVSFTATAAGTYYIAAGAYGSATGEYTLSLGSTTVSDSVAASTSTTGVIAVNGSVSGSVDSARDVDWYRVTLTANQQYLINLRGQPTGNGTLADPEFFGVYNASGTLISGTGNDDSGGVLNAQVVFRPTTTGTYYLAAGGHYESIGTYTLSLATSSGGDIAGNATTSAAVAVGGTFRSAIETVDDVDWIRVNLTAGQSYQVTLNGYGSTGNLSDPEIDGIYGVNGLVIAGTNNDDYGGTLNSRVDFTATTTGAYYIAASGHGARTGAYELAVNTATAPTDTAAPRLLALSPTDNSTGVSTASNLSLTFDEAVRAGSGNVVISGSNGTTRTISVTDTSQVSFRGDVMTVNPSADLAAGVNYTVTLQSGAVRDLAGNAYGGITGTSQFNFSTAATSTTTDAWTIMVYIAGDNDLEGFGISDLNEMEMANLPANVNVVFLYDRNPGYSTGAGNWTDTRVGAITHDGTNTNLSSATTSWGELNTGSGATLTRFIDWSADNYTAQNYGLVVWNHGGGLEGVAWDNTSNDNLTLKEMRQAVDSSRVSEFDLIGFDACLQGMVEQAFDFRGMADVLVASQDLEPGDGWAYDRFLPSLASNPGMTSSDLASLIVSSYGQEYAGQSGITLSATRLSALTALDTALDGFVSAAKSIPTSSSDWTAMRTAAERAVSFNGNMHDLGDFMDEVAARVSNTALRSAANNVGTSLDNAIIANTGTVAGAEGLSIYLPYGTQAVRPDYTATNYSFLSQVAWNDFLGLI